MNETWEDTVRTAFERVRRRLDAAWPVESDGSGPAERTAMKAAIRHLEPQISVIALRVAKTKHLHYEDDFCCILIYDFSWPGPMGVKFLGDVEMHRTSLLRQILVEQLAVPFAEYFLRDLEGEGRTIGLIDTDALKSLQFVKYDPRKRQGGIEIDMYLHLGSWLESTVERPDPLEDYAKRYGLNPSEVPSEEVLKEPDLRIRSFGRFCEGKFQSRTIRDLAENVSRIILIPPVPDEVNTTFQQAKDLYVQSYYKYDFFTISALFAYMAVEAAIRHRWCQSLSLPIRLELPEKRGGKKQRITLELNRAEYGRMEQFCFDNGRSAQELLVNGKSFPDSMRDLLDQLVREGTMNLWERKQCEFARRVRNSLAHPEYPSVYLPSRAIVALRTAALIINSLFDSVGAYRKESNHS